MAGIPISAFLPNVLGAINPSALAPHLTAAQRAAAAKPKAAKTAEESPAKEPSLLEKILGGMNNALASPSDAPVMGMAQGLLAASAPHMLTPVPMGQALGMGLAQSQAYQKAALANAMQRAVLPMAQAKTQAVVQGLKGGTRASNLYDKMLLANVLGGPGAAANIVKMDPSLVKGETAAKNAETPIPLKSNESLVNALAAARGKNPIAYGNVPAGGVQNRVTGATGLAPGGGQAVAASAAAQGYGSSQGGLQAAVTKEQAAPHSLAPGAVLGSVGGQVGTPPIVQRALQQQAMQRAVGTEMGATQAAHQAGTPPPFAPPQPPPQPTTAQTAPTSPFQHAAAPSGQGVTGGMPLVQADLTKGYAAQTQGELKTVNQEAEAAKAMIQPLNEMLSGFQQLGAGGKWQDIAQKVSELSNYLGMQPPKFTTRAEVDKYMVQLVGKATKSISARASTQEMQFISKSVPNYGMPGVAPVVLTAQLKGVQEYAVMRANAMQAYISNINTTGGFKGTTYGFERWWNKTGINPTIMALNATLRALPPPEAAAYYKKLDSTVTGRQLLKQLSSAYKFEQANPNILGQVQ